MPSIIGNKVICARFSSSGVTCVRCVLGIILGYTALRRWAELFGTMTYIGVYFIVASDYIHGSGFMYR